jgi:hypothetical protein
MKSRIIFLFVCFSVLSCNDRSTSENDLDATQDSDHTLKLGDIFPDLYAYLKSQAPQLKDEFEGGAITLMDTTQAVPITHQEIKRIQPYLIFNSDSSFAIDLVSNNFIVDTTNKEMLLRAAGANNDVATIDFRYNRRRSFLFPESPETMLDANWESDSTVLVVAASETKDQKVKLVIWRYYVYAWLYNLYGSDQQLDVDIRNYLREKLSKRYLKPATLSKHTQHPDRN